MQRKWHRHRPCQTCSRVHSGCRSVCWGGSAEPPDLKLGRRRSWRDRVLRLRQLRRLCEQRDLNPLAPVSSDVAALGNGIATGGGVPPQPPGPPVQAPDEGPRPGEQWLRNGTSGAIAPASKEGYGFVRDAQGNTAERRIPGSPGAGVHVQVKGGHGLAFDKLSGKLVSDMLGLPDDSRVVFHDGPGGTAIYQSGKQIGTIPYGACPTKRGLQDRYRPDRWHHASR